MGDVVPAGTIVELLPKNRYRISCHVCGAARVVNPKTESRCATCLNRGRRAITKGSVLRDGRKVLDEDRSVRPPKFLVNCICCGTPTWKQRTTLYHVCFSCRPSASNFPFGEDELAKKLARYIRSAIS